MNCLMDSEIYSEKARRDISRYTMELNAGTGEDFHVVTPMSTPEYWHLDNNLVRITSGDPFDIVKRLQQIAREHGLQWELPDLKPDSWWPADED